MYQKVSLDMEITGVYNYKGSFIDMKDVVSSGIFENGDVICVGDDTYVYIEGSFEKIGGVGCEEVVDNSHDNRSLIEIKCSSCGAPLMIPKYSSDIKCEYCGTTYYRK